MNSDQEAESTDIRLIINSIREAELERLRRQADIDDKNYQYYLLNKMLTEAYASSKN